MNRRSFLSLLGLAPAAAAVAKLPVAPDVFPPPGALAELGVYNGIIIREVENIPFRSWGMPTVTRVFVGDDQQLAFDFIKPEDFYRDDWLDDSYSDDIEEDDDEHLEDQ